MTEMTSQSASAKLGAYTVQHDRITDTPLTVAVAEAVATFRDVDVVDLEPLHYAINADALERLFEPRSNATRSGGTVTFEYSECLVTVTADGEIRIESA